jgi:DNA-binding HxlR family transcriptional regulator
MECPIKKTLDAIGGKWKLLIIYQFNNDVPIRFGELRRLLPDISEKVLMQELNSLVSNKILKKKSYPVVPPKVEYTIHQLLRNCKSLELFIWINFQFN